MSTKEEPNAAAIINAIKEMLPPPIQHIEFDGLRVPVLVSRNPDDGSLHSMGLEDLVDPARVRPRARSGSATFTNQTSFEEHAKRFAGDNTTLWGDRGDRTSPKLVSVLDYHHAGADGLPEFGAHRGVYRFPLSEEWRTWTAADGASMDQARFAEFIESNLLDVVSPDSAPDHLTATLGALEMAVASATQLVQLSRGLKVFVSSEVEDTTNLSSGECEIRFKIEHRDKTGGKLRVPGALVIHVPVFDGGVGVTLAVLLRYQVVADRLMWTLKLYRPTAAFDAAFSEACLNAASNTGLPLFFGVSED